jgi:aminoglycoside phosphotransferase (APT) family kinase protein
MNEQLTAHLKRHFEDADEIVIEELTAIPGGFSCETFRFDARVRRGGREEVINLILRRDPPAAADILPTDRSLEMRLIDCIRAQTGLPVSRTFGAEMNPEVFGQPGMIIERLPGSGQTTALFNGGPDEAQAEHVCRHLCELIAELHLLDISKLELPPEMHDPRGVGIDTSSWDAYMESTFEYYVRSYHEGDWDALPVQMDAYLTVRREKPRPLRLSLVHGDFNPANFLYEGGKVTAIFDWENARIGDPREDLGWMQTMDLLSATDVMGYPKAEGGFLAYYNRLTGFEVTQDEVNYFSLFGTCNIATKVLAAMKRRMVKEHMELLHLYLMQPNINNAVNYGKMLGYPMPEGV